MYLSVRLRISIGKVSIVSGFWNSGTVISFCSSLSPPSLLSKMSEFLRWSSSKGDAAINGFLSEVLLMIGVWRVLARVRVGDTGLAGDSSLGKLVFREDRGRVDEGMRELDISSILHKPYGHGVNIGSEDLSIVEYRMLINWCLHLLRRYEQRPFYAAGPHVRYRLFPFYKRVWAWQGLYDPGDPLRMSRIQSANNNGLRQNSCFTVRSKAIQMTYESRCLSR